jgi:HlyD family secretion protein
MFNMPTTSSTSETEPVKEAAASVSAPSTVPSAPGTPPAPVARANPATPATASVPVVPTTPPPADKPKRRTPAIVFLLVVVFAVGAGGWLAWWLIPRHKAVDQLDLHGNVDLRQVNLPFNDNERIAAVLVQEGDRVQKGQVLARLDTSRLEPQVAQMEAQAGAQRAIVERFHNGNRPEEIAEARANLQSAVADAANARRQYQRLVNAARSSSGRDVSQTDLDNAKAATEMADAKVAVNEKALELEVIGPRKEDVAQAEAQLRDDDAQVALMRRKLADAQLVAPCAATVRSRLMEPGEMASPQTPVFSLAITDPKWIRAYVDEPDLGNVHPGMAATVTTDSFPDRPLDGWVGFISPMAEFTPKDVQTEELRTSLVYEIRVFVKDPGDELRLGMPATVHLSIKPSGSQTAATQGSP